MKSKFISNGPCNTCSSSDAMSTYEDGSTYCHSCKTPTKPKTSIQNVKDKIQSVRKDSSSGNGYLSLPYDSSFTISPVGYNWLSNYGLTSDEIITHKVQWSESLKALVFPIYEGKHLLFYQLRFFGGIKKWKSNGKKPVYTLSQDVSKTIVLVEDLISAICVSRVHPCRPLFGSSISMGDILYTSKKYDTCLIWLDKDKAKDSIKYSSAGSVIMACRSIITQKDPKCYSTQEIKEWTK